MGHNNSKVDTSNSEKDAWVMEALTVISDKTRSQQERRPHFNRLRDHFAPDTHENQSYSIELHRVFALRFPKWPAPSFAANLSTSQKNKLSDCIRGCIFGAALGDAAGLATEFLDKTTTLAHYGADFVFYPGCEVFADSHRMCFPRGDWTDDTDQLILILQSLLSTQGSADPTDFARRLVDWKDHGFPGLGDSGGCGLGKSTKMVITRDGYFEDPVGVARAVWKAGNCQVAANGAVMRTAVTGIPSFWNLDAVASNTKAFCETTHADPRCVASCVAVSSSVSLLLQSIVHIKQDSCHTSSHEIVNQAVELALKHLDMKEHCDQLKEYANCETLADLRLDEPKSIGYTFKCMGAGLWTLKQGTQLGFIPALRAVIAEGGDADTNATVAGALMGCYYGFSGLPLGWIDKLPYAQWLEAWVQKLLFMLDLPVLRSRETGPS